MIVTTIACTLTQAYSCRLQLAQIWKLKKYKNTKVQTHKNTNIQNYKLNNESHDYRLYFDPTILQLAWLKYKKNIKKSKLNHDGSLYYISQLSNLNLQFGQILMA